MQDAWQSGDPYDYYMGRWSRLVAEKFVDWLSPKSGLIWLDVGCGSGALSETIINRHNPDIDKNSFTTDVARTRRVRASQWLTLRGDG